MDFGRRCFFFRCTVVPAATSVIIFFIASTACSRVKGASGGFVALAPALRIFPPIATFAAASTSPRNHILSENCVFNYRQNTRTRLSATVSSKAKNEKDYGDEGDTATGWMHNQPSKKGEKSNSSITTRSQQPRSEEEPRTGWLHNTRPKAEIIMEENESRKRGQEQKNELEAVRLLRIEKEKRRRNHRILTAPVFHPCDDGRRVVVTEHAISVPVVRRSSDGIEEVGEDSASGAKMIDVYFSITELVEDDKDEAFFRSILRSETYNGKNDKETKKSAEQIGRVRADAYVRHAALTDMDGCILYLQGGPGFGAPAPISGIGLAAKSSWAGEAFSNGFKRVVLMDQRGTGRSTPITKQTLESRFPGLFVLDDVLAKQEQGSSSGVVTIETFPSTAETLKILQDDNDKVVTDASMSIRFSSALSKAVDYIAAFRADNIVFDAEDIKEALLLPQTPSGNPEQLLPRPWGAALGQSFGGFCMMTYLSLVDNPPKICLLTGGVGPMLSPLQDVYEALWNRVKERNLRYYEKYPGDVRLVKIIVKRLLKRPEHLPSGGILTARRFLQLGISLGGSPSAFTSLHNLLSSAIVQGGAGGDDDEVEFTRTFLKRMEIEQSFDDAPIYFLLHESIYADSQRASPTAWAAHSVYERRTRNPSEFSYELTSRLDSDEKPTLFFGEMVFPWMADGDYVELSGFGMRSLAHALAEKKDWTPLYDGERMKIVLGDTSNGRASSKAAAAVYYDDMYVDFDASMKVTKRGEPLGHCKVWITNEYQHSGLRDDGATIFSKLLQMTQDRTGIPS